MDARSSTDPSEERFVCKYFTAGDEYAVETTRDMDPERRGNRVVSGLMKAHITVYEPGDYGHPSLPTLRAFLADHIEPTTGLLSYTRLGPKLTIDPAPLMALPEEYLGYRVSPGATFVTHEALRQLQRQS